MAQSRSPEFLPQLKFAFFGSLALIYGGLALANNNEAVEAQATANVYEEQESYEEVLHYERTADDAREVSILNGLMATSGLILTYAYSIDIVKAKEAQKKRPKSSLMS